MRKFLGTLVLFVLLVAGVGFFRGWFSVSKEEQPGETNIELKIDKGRVKEDVDEVARRARQLGADANQPDQEIVPENVDPAGLSGEGDPPR